eukprot:7215536-Prymnesium_polylepis.1
MGALATHCRAYTDRRCRGVAHQKKGSHFHQITARPSSKRTRETLTSGQEQSDSRLTLSALHPIQVQAKPPNIKLAQNDVSVADVLSRRRVRSSHGGVEPERELELEVARVELVGLDHLQPEARRSRCR